MSIAKCPESADEKFLQGMLQEKFIDELQRIADQSLDRILQTCVLGRSLLLALPGGGHFPEEVLRMDVASPADFAALHRSLQEHQTASRLPPPPEKGALVLNRHRAYRSRLAQLFGSCNSNAAQHLARTLANPSELQPERGARANPSERDIALLAESIWADEGCPDGRAEIHWKVAQLQLDQTLKQAFGVARLNLNNVLETAQSNPAQRGAMRARFRFFLQTPDRQVAYEVTRQAFDTLSRITEVPNWKGKFSLRTSQDGRELRPLREVVQCRQRREEIETLGKIGNRTAQAAKESAVAYEVFGEAMKFRHHLDLQNGIPYYQANTPPHILEEEALSCFGGPWVMAVMLLEAGIPAERIFFCDEVQYAEGAHFGDHGSLLVRLCDNTILRFDAGYGSKTEDVRLKYAVEADRDAFRSLLLGKSHDPVLVHFGAPHQREHSLPQCMQILPLLEGIASIHMLNTGLHFLHENKQREAQYAFEIGLGFNEKSTYLLSHLGLVLFQQGQKVEAKECLDQALKIDPQHLYAHFFLGEWFLDEGDMAQARLHFNILRRDSRNIWGDGGTLMRQASTYEQCTDNEMRSMWRKKQDHSARRDP